MKRTRALLIAVMVLAGVCASGHFVIDDGLIYARFIRNALLGEGLVFNPGESYNALTSPLFSYLLLGASWLLHGHILLAEHLLFAAAFLPACLFAESIAPWAGVAIASTAYFYTLIGLESSLFLLMILLVAKTYASRRYGWLPILLVLTLLTRFEGALLVPIVGVLLWRERKFPRLITFLPAILVLVGYVALNQHWYGALLPSSASAKFGQARSGYWGRWPLGFLHAHMWAFRGNKAAFRWTAYIVPLILWFGYRGWRRVRTVRIHQVLAPFWVGLFLFYILFNMPAYAWYYAPLILIAYLYAVMGLPSTRGTMTALAAVLLVSWITNLWVMTKWGPDWDYVNVAEWLNANTPDTASVETVELGQIGWYTHRHVVDILGLTLPKNADHIAHRDADSWLAEDRPNYIIIHRPLATWEKVTGWHPEYRELPFHSGNIHLLQRTGP